MCIPNKIAIHWFRQDLRLSDNPALTEASKYASVLPIYILDNKNAGKYLLGSASKCWLHHSLKSLNLSLGNSLSIYQGDPLHVFDDLLARFKVEVIYWNRCYEPWRIQRDKKLKEYLKSKNIEVKTFNGSLLWEPWEIRKDDGTPYKVFTPFYNKGNTRVGKLSAPLPVPQNANYISDKNQLGIDSLNLLPKKEWEERLTSYWNISEKGAQENFQDFMSKRINYYKKGRDFPSESCISKLSPYLHFGEISPNQVWYGSHLIKDNQNIEHFCRQLMWREFSYNQLYYNPELPHQNLQSKFDYFPWIKNNNYLRAWQKGETGIPMIDAGMRELWQTGYMHNRVRMLVGSFLVKNLRLHWHEGAQWFWDTLVDADLANNSASWQWIAGCGADAAPYFRIFNPVTQGQKFDSEGRYIRQFIPEISALPDKYLFNPWEAPGHILNDANIKLGETYPYPIVDLKESRKEALNAFKTLNETWSFFK